MTDPYRDLRGFRAEKSAEPTPLGKVLTELIALKGLARVQANQQFDEAWNAIAGDQISRHSMVLGLSRGILQIGVANAAILAEISGFHKQALLKKIQKQQPHWKVKDIKLRLTTDVAPSRGRTDPK